MSESKRLLSFSQRNGFSSPPPQLVLGEVSEEQRRLLFFALHNDLKRNRNSRLYSSVNAQWRNMALDIHVRVLGQSPIKFSCDIEDLCREYERAINSFDIGDLYDLIEFIIRHENCGIVLYMDFHGVFEETRSAYRIIDHTIVAIGTDEQRETIVEAINSANAIGADAARQHLISSGEALRTGDWAASIRESIHAVEAMVIRLNPETKTLGKALAKVEKSGHLHSSLKSAFEKLYAYTNDERGIRHSKLYEEVRADEADEADAIFMYGACASFVSYLAFREKDCFAN